MRYISVVMMVNVCCSGRSFLVVGEFVAYKNVENNAPCMYSIQHACAIEVSRVSAREKKTGFEDFFFRGNFRSHNWVLSFFLFE